MSLFRPHDPEPWRACYQQLAPRLLLFARQWVESLADAEDVVQTAFVRFWHREPEAAPEHYPLLYAAVRTAALDFRRARERRGRRELTYGTESAALAGPALFESPLEQQESAAAWQSALTELPEKQREVLVLRIWGELTFAEIGVALGESVHTVASRYRAALECLRRHLHRLPTLAYD